MLVSWEEQVQKSLLGHPSFEVIDVLTIILAEQAERHLDRLFVHHQAHLIIADQRGFGRKLGGRGFFDGFTRGGGICGVELDHGLLEGDDGAQQRPAIGAFPLARLTEQEIGGELGLCGRGGLGAGAVVDGHAAAAVDPACLKLPAGGRHGYLGVERERRRERGENRFHGVRLPSKQPDTQ